MAFKNGCYATLWNIEKDKDGVVAIYDRYAEIFITTSRKNREGKYETDFSGRVRCLGNAFETIKQLSLKQQDKLRLMDVECSQNKVKDKIYNNYVCWEIETTQSKVSKPKETQVVGEAPVFANIDDDDLPF